MESKLVLDDLQNGYYIWQRNDGFKFGIDAVLLSDFAKSCTGRVMDLCTGTGIIPLLLVAKSRAEKIDAVELQPEIADMAKKSVEYNKLDGRIHIECADLKAASGIFGKGRYNCVTVNPPYMKTGAGFVNAGDMKTISRHEVCCTVDDVIKASAELLTPFGKLYMIHRPSRLADIFSAMRKYSIEPKLMRFVASKQGREPNLVLVHGVKNARSDLKMLPQLYVYDENGRYSKEIDEIYGR